MTSKYRIVRFPELLALVALSRATIYRRMAKGTFPNRLKLGKRAVGWRWIEIEDWLIGLR